MNSNDTPTAMLQRRVGEEVLVRLRNETRLVGTLVAFDEHFNLMMEDVKITKKQEVQEKHLMYLRGDTVLLVARTQ